MMRARVRSWLRSLFLRTRMEENMDAELQFHIESYAQRSNARRTIERGSSPAGAG